MLSKIEAFIAAHPVIGHAAKAFVFAAVPLVIAAYSSHGVSGVTVAVVLSAIIAGAHAAYQALVVTTA